MSSLACRWVRYACCVVTELVMLYYAGWRGLEFSRRIPRQIIWRTQKGTREVAFVTSSKLFLLVFPKTTATLAFGIFFGKVISVLDLYANALMLLRLQKKMFHAARGRDQ